VRASRGVERIDRSLAGERSRVAAKGVRYGEAQNARPWRAVAADVTAVAVVASTNKTRIIQALLDNVSRATSDLARAAGCQYSRASSVTGNWKPLSPSSRGISGKVRLAHLIQCFTGLLIAAERLYDVAFEKERREREGERERERGREDRGLPTSLFGSSFHSP